MFGGCSCLLIGDWGQLPPVMDLPLYTTVSRTELSDLGSVNYHLFDHAITLDQVMRQAGNDSAQQLFRNILMRLRNGELRVEDWKHLIQQTPVEVDDDTSGFDEALRLFPTTSAVTEYNVTKLHSNDQPVAVIKAVHSGAGAIKASADDAGGLEPVVCLAHGARVMLTTNLWVQVGLVNGAMGTVVAICYDDAGESPPRLPVAVTVQFDSFSGPTLSDGSVPITPLRRTWLSTDKTCSRLQLPLKLAWAVTIHKCQGMTLNKAVVDLGKKEFSAGLTFVACSRVRQLKDLLFVTPFPFQRVANLASSYRHSERLHEEKRLQTLCNKQLSGEVISSTSPVHVMDMCESTNLAAEAETTSIEPKIPMCEAQVDRVSCISQSVLSHSLNVAAQKVSVVPNVPCVQAKMDGTDNVMDMCESTNLGAETETTSIEPKIPMCEAQVDRVGCISQSALSHSLNVAAQKVSEVPNVPCVQAKMDGTDSELAITGVYTDNSHFKYNPVDVEWQLRVCRLLGLGFCGPNRITPASPNAPLANPVGFKNIRGDGNCMFRSLSFIITGSEDQHMHVRRAIIRHMRDIGNVLWESQISPLLNNLRSIGEVSVGNNQSPNADHMAGINQYIAATRMDHDKTWGSEVEIMVLAHLLDTAVYSYDTARGWNRYTPANVYGQFDVSTRVNSQMAMYVRYNINHYDVVTSVE